MMHPINHIATLKDPRYGLRAFMERLVGKIRFPGICFLIGHRWVPAWWLEVDGSSWFVCARCGKEHERMTRGSHGKREAGRLDRDALRSDVKPKF